MNLSDNYVSVHSPNQSAFYARLIEDQPWVMASVYDMFRSFTQSNTPLASVCSMRTWQPCGLTLLNHVGLSSKAFFVGGGDPPKTKTPPCQSIVLFFCRQVLQLQRNPNTNRRTKQVGRNPASKNRRSWIRFQMYQKRCLFLLVLSKP